MLILRYGLTVPTVCTHRYTRTGAPLRAGEQHRNNKSSISYYKIAIRPKFDARQIIWIFLLSSDLFSSVFHKLPVHLFLYVFLLKLFLYKYITNFRVIIATLGV